MGRLMKSLFKKLLYIISPCVLVAAFCLLAIVDSYMSMESSGGWSILGVVIFKPVLIGVLIVGTITKLLLKKQVFLLGLVELISIGVFYIIFVSPYVG